MPNVWGKDGILEGKYHRHSVDKDVNYFIGWFKLAELFMSFRTREIEGFKKGVAEKHPYCDVALIAFKLAARITEALYTRAEWFDVTSSPDVIVVNNFPVLKRWKAIETQIRCARCSTINDKFSGICTSCGANLVFAGKKMFKTEPVIEYRQPVFIKKNEKYSKELIELVKKVRFGLLFPSPHKLRQGKPYSRQWAYLFVKHYGEIVGLDNLYNHYFRAQRLMQLRLEYEYSKDDLKMFTAIKADETLDHYIKDVQSYIKKTIGKEIDPDLFAKMTKYHVNNTEKQSK